MLTVEIVTAPAQFEALADEWKGLLAQAGDARVFVTHAWFLAAWQWAQHDAQLHVVCVRGAGSQLVGVFPGCVRRRVAPAVDVLEFLTIPDSPYCDLPCLPEAREAVLDAVLRSVLDTRGRWDIVEFGRLRIDGPTLGALDVLGTRQRRRVYPCAADVVQCVRLDGSWDEYYSTRSRRLKKGNNLVANHLRKQYPSIECLQSAGTSVQERAQLREALTQISSRSWKAEGANTFDHAGPAAFLARWLDAAGSAGWLRVWLLRLDGQPVASELQVLDGDIVHALRADFDSSYDKWSPGTYLNWQILQSLFGRGLRSYAMGTGRNAYKLRWVNDTADLGGRRFYGGGLRALRLRLWAEQLRPWLRALRARLRGSRDAAGAGETAGETAGEGERS